MSPQEAGQVADMLTNAFASVVVHGERAPIAITAREHFRMERQRPCSHDRQRVSHNVSAAISHKWGVPFCVSPSDRLPAQRYAELVECAACEQVLSRTAEGMPPVRELGFTARAA